MELILCCGSNSREVFNIGQLMLATVDDCTFLAGNPELQIRLKQCTNLPSPPGVAAQIIALGQDPVADMGRVADVVGVDPALTSKLFRVANSALYARQRKTENLRQAIMLFGLNGTLTLALSFSLTSALRVQRGEGLDYQQFWRRSLTAATACRAIGSRLNAASKDDLFLAGLLQDVGMLALDKIAPEIYTQLGAAQSDHRHVQAAEREALGSDHAAVGAWLLDSWHLPAHLVQAVAGSHDPSLPAITDEHAPLVRCAALASAVADIWSSEAREPATEAAADLAEQLLGMDRDSLVEVLDVIAADLQETAAWFEVDLGDTALMESIRDQAKEILMLRNLQSMQQAAELHKKTESLETRTRELEEETRRDRLTGLYNRAYLDQCLLDEFTSAKRQGWPLTVIFADLDRFKKINDTYGHHAGDEVLRGAARLLEANTRDTDIVGRYGGEEFVLVLPGTAQAGARVTCDRLIDAFRTTEHDIGTGKPIRVTMSAGVAIQGKDTDYDRYEDLVQAADRAVYTAKQQGRDRWLLKT